MLAVALRFEDFDDFGTTTNYRLGFNYAFNENLACHSSAPGQSNASNISTQIINGVLTNQGVIPSTSCAPIDQGAYATLGVFDITVDYFDIDVDDRLSLSIFVDMAATLAGQGIDASDISQFRFFTDAFNTNTSGFDIVVSTETEWLNGL